MKYHLNIRSRPDSSESVEEKHEKIISGLLSLGSPWGIVEVPQIEPRKLKVDGLSLFRFLGKGIKGILGYSGRFLTDDRATNDDTFLLRFDADKVPYALLLEKALKVYIQSFSVYSIACTHDDFFMWNEDDVEKGPFLISDPRLGVDRFGPINFFDELLCQRAFNKTCTELHDLLIDKVAHCELFGGGILIYLSLHPMSFEKIKLADKEIMATIGAN